MRALATFVDRAARSDALQKVYGQSPLTIDGVFEQWVKANYSARSPR